MLRQICVCCLFVVAALAASACGDSALPTAPDAVQGVASGVPRTTEGDYTPQGCVSDGTCVLDPIVVIGRCEVTYKYNGVTYCGDQCIMSGSGEAPVYAGDGDVVQGCDGSGGGGTGGGTGGGWTGGGGGGGTGDGSGGGTAPGPVPPPTDTCYTGDQIVDDPDVFGGFREMWEMSIREGVERGGWVVQDGPGAFRLVPFQNATYTACGVDIHESPPAGTVSLVHTHPWPVLTTTPCGYLNTGTPSEEDVSALQQTGLAVGYFLDSNGIGRFTPASGVRADRTVRCGY